MQQLKLDGRDVKVLVNDDLSLSVRAGDGELVWESSREHLPQFRFRNGNEESKVQSMADAADVSVGLFAEGAYKGHRISLSGYPETDAALALVIALDAEQNELLIQIEQVSGQASVLRVDHLYRFERPVSQGGYMVLPRGSGYLVPAECPDELPGSGNEATQIGGDWCLPMLGITRDRSSLCAIVDTWWDAEVRAHHVPGDRSLLDFSWGESLGKLGYPRRMFLRFDEDSDYVAMARFYRARAAKQGLVRTLEEKAEQTPLLREYVRNILFRWVAWNGEDGSNVLADVRRIRDMGLGVNFFYPKWGSASYSHEKDRQTNSVDHDWQAFLVSNPVDGGWPWLVDYANQLHEMGCVVQAFVRLQEQLVGRPGFDESRWALDASGNRLKRLSSHDAVDIMVQVLDSLEERALRFDLLYFDGYAASHFLTQDHSPEHPVSRRQAAETQNACFRETRRRGIMAGAELRQFWAMGDCDWCFFTDWAGHRLSNVPVDTLGQKPVGEPIPLCQLVFHDCCVCGFSGDPGQGVQYDWYQDRSHRLYELMFGSAPCYNWVTSPKDRQPVPIRDWNSQKTARAFEWLKKWSSYYQSVAMSPMVSHQFLSGDRMQQQVTFANGVSAEIDLAEDRYRISGIAKFDGNWQRPEAF
jgi:hypothetical protein